MGSKRKDLTGQKFGRLTVLGPAEDYISPKGKHVRRFWVICDCGKSEKFMARYPNLIGGTTKSCGCLALEARIKSGRSKKQYNTYDLSGAYGIGYTLKGEEFWFDLEDYDKIKDYCWYYYCGYLTTNDYSDPNKQKQYRFHRLVMGITDPNIMVDHIKHPKGDELKIDNRKSNLRIASNSQNQMNKHIQSNNTSGVPGVSYHRGRWEAYISINKKYTYIGGSKNFDEAVKIRKDAEKKYYKDYRFDYSLEKE